jgi:bifunctional DNA-binding transcriptional regulator/antitoxin component of YhaV-PrlF toxin-antitoxin module
MSEMLRPELIGTATIRNGGHIVLPEKALEKLGLTDGDELVVFVGTMKHRIILTQTSTLEEGFEKTIAELKHMQNFMRQLAKQVGYLQRSTGCSSMRAVQAKTDSEFTANLLRRSLLYGKVRL